MKMRKIIAVMAAALMLFSILPISAMAAEVSATLSFANKAQRTSFSASQQVWEQNGIKLINNKASSTSAVADYANPARFYANSEIIVECAGMTQIVFDCNSGTYASAIKTSIGSTATVAVSSDKVTVTLDGVDSFKIAKLSAQVRMDSVTVTYIEGGSTEPECEHAWDNDCDTDCNLGCGETREAEHNYVEDIIDATCTETGTATYECSVCYDSYDEIIPVKPHNYVDGYCSVCNEPQPLEATIDFSTKDQRTQYTTSVQQWENDGLVLTNNKGGSTSNVGDFSNPARFYKGSEIVIVYEGMTKLAIDAVGIGSSYLWESTLNAAGVSYAVDNQVYTIIFNPSVDSITLTAANQVRANSITVYGSAPSDCEHDYVGVETQAPTCTVEGVMTYTCSKCEESYTDSIDVIPHDYVEDIIDSTCTTTGTKTYECSVCHDSYDEAIPMAPHNYVNDVCDACGAVKVYKGTITFDADKTQRVEYSTQTQKWENEGLTFVNNKGISTTNVGDYSNPGRFYKNSDIIIEFAEMSKLIIDAANVGNDYLWDATLDAADLTYTVVDGVYTITFAEPVSSVTLKTSNQVRANSITAIVAHECVYDDNFDVECNKCGDIREVEILTFNGKSASEDVAGLAFLFSVKANGVEKHENTQNTFKEDSGEIEIDGVKYTLKYAGAVVTNKDLAAEDLTIANAQDNGNKTIKNIGAKYMWNFSENGFKYAIRIINIPEANWDTVISARPYYIYADAEGNSVVIYGEVQTGTYNACIG